MSDLAALLQSALGAAYEVRRELGGGGMARVFVVADKALGRQIVVKVLPPEQAAAVSSERFRREIQLLAGPSVLSDFLAAFNLAVASLHAREGNADAALDAARRRVFWGPRSPALASAAFWQQGHAAAQAGERELAITALRAYVALRSNPEPSLLAPRDEARRLLALLVRSEVPQSAAKR